ncbi:MAG: O-antigen ligase family protein, partial [Deltaproteobacteria bacterium]|nr:O-antigen ligase family protein [Deltaproteobacteria bacterium]
QKMTWNGSLYWFYPLRPELSSRASRIFGPYVNRNHFAGYMELAIPLTLGFALYKYSNAGLRANGIIKRFAEFSTRAEFAPVVLYSLAAMMLSSALFTTLSRGGVLGFVSSGVFFTALASSRKSLKRGGQAAALAAVFMLAFVLFMSWTGLESRFVEVTNIDRIQRLDVWADSIGMWRNFPVTGIGLGAFQSVYRLYQSKHPLVTFEHAENDYVELTCETGALGAAAVAVLIVLFFYVTIKKWRTRHGGFVKCTALGGMTSCVALAVHSLTDFNMRIPANAMTLTVIAAATYATLFNVPGRIGAEGEPDAEAAPRGKGRNYMLSAAAVLIPAFLAFFPVKGLVSEYYWFTAYSAIDDRTTDYADSKPISIETAPDYLEAAGRLETASYISKNRAVYYKDAAGIYAALARWNEAVSHAGGAQGSTGAAATGLDAGALYAKAVYNLEKAVELTPVNPWYHLTLSGVHEDFHPGSGLSEKHLRLSVSSYPVNVEVHFIAAREHLNKGRIMEAAAEALAAAKTDDSYIIEDALLREGVMAERGMAYYRNYGGSYLFKAFDIIWRAKKDINSVKEACPDNPDAIEVLRIFMEQKGLAG